MFTRLLIVFDLLVAAVVLFFFFWGVSDGTVSSFNIRSWLVLLAATVVSLVGGIYFQAKGSRLVAILFLSILALPGLAMVLFTVIMLVINPRWN